MYLLFNDSEQGETDDTPVDVQAVEGALSNCRLRKLRIVSCFVSLFLQV